MAMDNRGKLVEAWLITCKECWAYRFLYWRDGINMSKSQAIQMISKDFGWIIKDDYWICPDCQ